MALFFRRFDVGPSETGALYRDHRRERAVGPGVYRRLDPGRRLRLYTVPTVPQAFPVYAQEALTKDGVAFRFSYTVRYAVADPERVLAQADLGAVGTHVFGRSVQMHNTPAEQAQALLHAYVQTAVKERVAALTAEEITDDRARVGDFRTPALDAQATTLGLEVLEILVRDVTFPKTVQRLFARRLEASIRAQSDLENARTTVAAARALKNASAMLAGDRTVLFLQTLETLTRISESGHHTFHLALAPPASEARPDDAEPAA